MPRMLGDAFVTISPDTRAFRASADRQVKQALAGLRYEVPLGINTKGSLDAIRALQQKLRAQGLADFLDVNIPVGRLITQIQIIRRLLNQAGVADILEVDLDKASLARARAQLGKLSGQVQVTFDISKMPVVGPLAPLRVPVAFDVSKIPKLPVLGGTENIGVSTTGIASAVAMMKILDGSLMKTAMDAMTARDNFMAWTTGLGNADAAMKILDGSLMRQVLAQQAANQAAGEAVMDTANLRNAIRDVTVSVQASNKRIADAIPLWKATGGWWGFLTGKVQLFGGALTGLGVPAILATASAAHILIDAAIEIAAVIIPAGIAVLAFGAMAAPTLNDIQKKMQAVWTTSVALNQAIYPLTSSMQSLEQAVRPQVIQLFGEALYVVTKNTGLFATVAQQAGKVLDTLGARAAVALTSGGFATFLKEGPHDLAMIGDIIANIFGTIGNLLHVIPGYAQVLIGALDGLTKGIEAVTASPIGQWAAGVFLAFHGFILWAGLGATAAVFLGNALLSLGAKFGLAAAGMTVFDAAAFGAGIKQMLSGVGLLAGEMVTLGAGEDIAAAGALTLEGAWAAITAINPVVWIGAAIGGLIALVLWVHRSASATQSYNDAVNASLRNAPVSQLSVDLVNRMADTTGNLRAAQDQLNRTQEYATILNIHTGTTTQVVTRAYADQAAIVKGYKGELATLQGYQANYNQALRAAGGNTSFLTGTSISLNDAIMKGGQALKEYIVEVQANADAQQALSLGTGRAAAAQQAQTNIFMTETLPAMQKVTQAEDSIVSVLLSGEQAFTGFDQALITYSQDLGVSASAVLGLNSAQVTQASDLYSTVIPAFQKTIDAAQQMGVHTQDLVPIIATEAKQVLTLAGNNNTARAAMVALINNALGPGTVSYKTLDKWLAQNSTTQQGLTADWAKATTQAATLAGVLQQDLNAQFAQALLKSSGATADIQRLTDAITHGGTQTQAYRSARAQLIQDLINTGMSATDAKNYVKNLQTQIDNLHGKTVGVDASLSGSGGLTLTASGMASKNMSLNRLAAGGLIRAGTGPTADDVLLLASKGETVVSAADSKKLAPAFRALGIPGYAGGGLAGAVPWTASSAGSDIQAWAGQDLQSWINADIAAWKQQAAGSAAGLGAGQGAGYQNFIAAAKQAMADTNTPSSWLNDLSLIALYESGYNPYAVNKTDSNWLAGHPSVGLMQVIAGTYAAYGARQFGYPPPVAYGVSENSVANIGAAIGDIKASYGSVFNVPGVVSVSQGGGYVGYDKGGWLPPGMSLAWNGTGRPEPVGFSPGGPVHITISFDDSVQQVLSPQQIRAIKYHVRTHGGTGPGAVDRAFGRVH